MAARLVSVPFGEPATRMLVDTVAGLRGGDPLAPLTVTVPAATAGVTLRRRLACDAGTGGLVGVTVQSLPQLVARLAAPALADGGRAPLSTVVLRGHLRAALRQLDGGPLARAATSPATERALELTVRELAAVDDAALDALAGTGEVGAAVVAVARKVQQAAAAAGRLVDRAAELRAAVDAVGAGRAGLDAIGPVVVHLPRRLGPSEVDLLAALHHAGHDVAVLVGRCDDPHADEPGRALLGALAAALGVRPEHVPGDAPSPQLDELVRAPDPAEEAAVAARLVLDAVAGGAQPERIAVLYRVGKPYAELLHEQLGAAGVPHHAPSVRTLAQSVTGRVLLGALALPDGDWRRSQVVAWWRSGPVRKVGSASPVPVARWDRLAREAGVVHGIDQWHQRLEQAAARRREYLAAKPAADGDATLPELDDHRLAGIEALAAEVDALARLLAAPHGRSWTTWSSWARAVLDAVLGQDHLAEGWPEEERDSRAAVVAAIAELARLDGIDAPPDLRRFRHALERELDRPARPHGRFGHGVAVGPIRDAVGADLDLAVIVGAAEGTFPPGGTDDALLPDRDRRAAGDRLPPRARTRGEEARDLAAVLAGARRRVLTSPRSDPRAQRERQPAPAFLDAVAARAGRLVASAELDALRSDAVPWFTDVESFEWWPGGAREPVTRADVELGALLAEQRAGRPVEGAASAVVDAALGRGLAAGAARRLGRFDEWSGNVGSRPDLLDGFDQPRSPTSLELYAACPFRYFLAQVLQVQPLDDPTDLEEISGRDIGSLVHAALEAFIRERGIGKPPDEPWSGDDRARLDDIARTVADAFEAGGRTGRPLLWGVRWEQIRRLLDAVLDADEVVRREWRTTPVAVEHAFGISDDVEPVVLDLDEHHRLAFRGVVDRIDRTDGGGLLVLDYKTGGKLGYEGLDDDITARGQRLQLGVYALAARQAHPDADVVDARYWFIGRGGGPDLVGRQFDAEAETRFREVVSTVVDGVVHGRFPANPGDERWDRGGYVHDHCKFCDYDRVCSTTRGWRWQQHRDVPELAAYVELAEGVDEEGESP